MSNDKSRQRIVIADPPATRLALRRAQLALLEAGIELSRAEIATRIITRTPIEVVLEELGVAGCRPAKGAI